MSQVTPFRDPVIIVMGVTGAGKSTFISKIANSDVGIGHELGSWVEFYSLEVNGRVVHFVDTPGFNDNWRSDLEILKEIAFIMSRIYQQDMRLAGILYLHRISDNRVTGAAMKNFSLLRELCGMEAAPWLTLVTSMWNLVDTETKDFEEAVLRESTLVSTDDFWGRLCQHGSQVKRWRLDDSSALSIVNDALVLCDGHGSATFQIQKELIDEGKPLHQTAGGSELSGGYEAAERRLLGEIQLGIATSDLMKEINELRSSRNKMMMSVKRLFAEKQRSYGKALSKVQDEQRKLAEGLEQSRIENEKLQADVKMIEETLKEERKQWKLKREKLDRHERFGGRTKESLKIERQRMEADEAIFEEEYMETEEKSAKKSQYIEKLRKRDVMKQNLLPFLLILAGVGMTVAGAVTVIPPLVVTGLSVTLGNASSINLSRRRNADDDGIPTSQSQISFSTGDM